MVKFNHEILLQFARRGLTINEGIAIDAWLVNSASRAISNEGLAVTVDLKGFAETFYRNVS